MPAAPAPAGNAYDDVPYDSFAYPQSHPSRLFTVAALFGLNPPPVETARVLELGCAAGGNLLPMAEQFPSAEFVGIDLSGKQVARGQAAAADAGLTNVTLRHASITEVDEGYGRFDYVVAHGVYSWVPDEVRGKIFDICAAHLAPTGVAYISYNTYPGWHMRGMIRDVMRYHALRFPQPAKRVEQARAVLDFLAVAAQKEPSTTASAWGALLKGEIDLLRRMPDHYLFHDHLAETNSPVYFHEFSDRAKARGLRYLGESRVNTMVPGNFGPEIEQSLRVLGSDMVETEQFMDFIRNRPFRESLLVRAACHPAYTIEPERVGRLHVASNGKPADAKPVDLLSAEQERYQSARGVVLASDRPLLKATMRILAAAWPATVPFADLAAQARGMVQAAGGTLGTDAEDAKLIAAGLLNCYLGSDMVELHGAAVTFAREVSARPVAAPVARRWSLDGPVVTNRRHDPTRVGALGQRLLPLLDGTRTRDDLLNGLTQAALTGELRVEKDGEAIFDPADVRAALGGQLDQELKTLAGWALLVA